MGSALCNLFREEPVNVLLFGLRGAGKTTLLYRLKLGEVIHTIPTLSFHLEQLDINGMKTVIWDAGLRISARLLIRSHLPDLDAIVWVIDSSNPQRFPYAVDEFFDNCGEAVQERQLPVLVLANKQDAKEETVLSPEQIKRAILEKGGEAFEANTALEVFPTVALTLEGVTSALEWMTSQLALKIAQRKRYLPSCSASQWPKTLVQFPASFVKSAYFKVMGLAWSSSEKEGGKDVEDGRGGSEGGGKEGKRG